MADVILGAEIAAVLPELRAQAESLMQDSCRITIPGVGEGVYDEATNTTTPPPPVQIYPDAGHDGRCRIQVAQLSSDKPLVAVDQLTVVQHILSIPFGTAKVPKLATVTITAVAPGELGDPALVGEKFTVRAILHKSQATSYRFQIDQIQLEAS